VNDLHRRGDDPTGRRRVVITGIGVVAPGGCGADAFWQRIVSGRPATRPVTAFDATGFRSRIAAECDFVPDPGLLPPERGWPGSTAPPSSP
jgi:act minimal PKS ketosynthase (KS/KS alpha)